MALTTRLPASNIEPFYGYVETTGDALRLIQAARQGIIPRITRRLNDLERRAMIRSGSVFVFSSEESGIKRWTEGLSWSASRIVGNFLVYREVLDRSSCPPSASQSSRQASQKSRGFVDSLSRASDKRSPKSNSSSRGEGEGRFKANGLIKKTITVKIEGWEHHLIAYYTQEDVKSGRLRSLSSRQDIMSLAIPPELIESTKFRVPPRTEKGPDGRPRYICDADETEPDDHRYSLPLPPRLSERSSMLSNITIPDHFVPIADSPSPMSDNSGFGISSSFASRTSSPFPSPLEPPMHDPLQALFLQQSYQSRSDACDRSPPTGASQDFTGLSDIGLPMSAPSASVLTYVTPSGAHSLPLYDAGPSYALGGDSRCPSSGSTYQNIFDGPGFTPMDLNGSSSSPSNNFPHMDTGAALPTFDLPPSQHHRSDLYSTKRDNIRYNIAETSPHRAQVSSAAVGSGNGRTALDCQPWLWA